MTDYRVCDSIECDEKAKLNENDRLMYESSPESFVTLTRPSEPDLHFHDRNCLNVWIMANLTPKVKAGP